MTVLYIILGAVAALWIGGAVTVFVLQFFGLSNENGTAARVWRSILSAVLWPIVLIALLIARRKA